MKKIVLFATALIALASCTNEEFTGDQNLGEANGKAPISFNFDVPATTRADNVGATAAAKLNNQFIVYAEKNETADGAAPVSDGTSTHQLVFPNYQVNYTASTAYTTTSNTKDWEYVGAQHTSAYQSNITTSTTDVQTIKYWDYSATNYVFTAVSALPADITAGNVKITKTTAKTDGNKVFDKGYTVVLTAGADPTKLYFSDRKVINQGTGTDRTATNAYGGNVTLTFRNGVSQVRAAMYETIPGYTVEIDKFYYADATTPAFTAMTTVGTDKFYANVPNLTTDKAATLTVTYYNSGDRVNQPKISVSGTSANYIALGTNLKDGTTLATTAATPTYDTSGGTYTTVFPQESNATNLKLKVDYTLKNATTGETIAVTGATAEVPAEFLQWKANFKYTYIFKISDNTNGSTGGSVVGLYPITFDAVQVVAEDGQTEYITTVSEPSITTYAKGSAVATNNEYASGETVYAVVEDGSTLATLSADNMKLYTVTTTDKTNFPITEASVAEALIEAPCMTTAEATNAKIKCTASSFTYGKTLVGEDGITVTMDNSKNVVASFTVAASTVYAIQYIKTAATYTNDGGKTYADATAFAAAGTLYTNGECTTAATSWTNGTTYYKKVLSSAGTYAYKIINVRYQ